MKADLCADGDQRESVDCFDMYLVIYPRVERGDEVGVGGVEGLAMRDVAVSARKSFLMNLSCGHQTFLPPSWRMV